MEDSNVLNDLFDAALGVHSVAPVWTETALLIKRKETMFLGWKVQITTTTINGVEKMEVQTIPSNEKETVVPSKLKTLIEEETKRKVEVVPIQEVSKVVKEVKERPTAEKQPRAFVPSPPRLSESSEESEEHIATPTWSENEEEEGEIKEKQDKSEKPEKSRKIDNNDNPKRRTTSGKKLPVFSQITEHENGYKQKYKDWVLEATFTGVNIKKLVYKFTNPGGIVFRSLKMAYMDANPEMKDAIERFSQSCHHRFQEKFNKKRRSPNIIKTK